MARKMSFRKLLALALVITTCITFTPSIAFAAEPAADAVAVSEEGAAAQSVMTAKATSDKITVTIKGAGSSGKAQLYAYGANEYHSADTMKGLSKVSKAQGTLVGTYNCGTNADITFNRYMTDGTDGIYMKYYLIQNGKIVAGPVYVSQFNSLRNIGRFNGSKKGLTMEDGSTIEVAKDMGVGNTVINWNLSEMIYANEDANGKKVDNSKRANTIAYKCNGETYYFSKSYVEMQDSLISAYSKAGINISLVIISWAKTWTNDYPSSLLYLPASEQAHTMGFNTSNDRGVDYWVAAMDFLANRYSQSADKGLIQQYVIGNEVDYVYDWYLMQPEKDSSGKYQRVEFNKFMEEYSRTVRLANQAVKKYNAGAKVCVSVTHNWAENSLTSYGYNENNRNSRRYNSYAPKDMLDWMIKYEGARGDYNWGIAAHPYPVGTSSSTPTITDLDPSKMNSKAKPVTGNWKTTPWVTLANLEVYQLYLQQPENKYNGTELRTVYLTETSVCSVVEGTAAAIEKSEMQQAASIAQTYYRAANIDCIESVDYFQLHDQVGEIDNKLGLVKDDGTKKPAYMMWKYIDTERSYDYTNRFLKYIAPNAKSYKDMMPLTKSGFNWNTEWSESNIQVRDVANGSTSVQRIYGAGRYDTALLAADKLKQVKGVSQFDNIVVASGTGFADALAGSYLAKVKNAPILLVNSKATAAANHQQIAEYINANLKSGGTVYILGGVNAVPEAFAAKVNANVKRLGGANRYETNLLILNEAGAAGSEIIVCTGTGFADSLSASASGRPILLVKGTGKSLDAKQKAYLNQNKGKKFYIIGGEAAVSKTMANLIKSYGSITRIGGANRYETSTLFAQKFFSDPDTAVLAYAKNFPDGLSGGPLAMALDAPLILTATNSEAKAVSFAKDYEVFSGIVLGGPTLISNGAVNAVFGTVR